MDKRLVSAIVLVLLLVLLPAGSAMGQGEGPAASAVLGTGFTYQGELMDSGGRPISSSCDFRFGLWDAAGGGTQVGAASTVPAVPVTEGLFTALVNAGGEFGANAFVGQARWLQVAVRCPAGSGSYTALAPRQPLTAAPYALHSLSAPWSGLGGVPAGFADGVDNDTTYAAGTGLSLNGGRFSVEFGGSGSAATAARGDHGHWGANWSGSGTGLTLSGGAVGLSGSGSQYGLSGQTASASGRGLYGYASSISGQTYGVEGTSTSSEGSGVWGRAVATSGEANGVYGYTSSTAGRGVYGLASATSGTTYGVYGRTHSTTNNTTGVLGYATGATGSTYGVKGWAASNEGIGVYGGGGWKGVEGASDAEYGIGVVGRASSATGRTYGVYAWSESPDGTAVYGAGNSGTGVHGSGGRYGVYGNAGRLGVAGYFANGWDGLALVAVSSTTGDILQVKNGDNTVFRVNGAGNVQADGGYHCGNNIDDGAGTLDENEIAPCLYDSSPADFAEMLPAAGGLEPGDVLAVGLEGRLVRSTERYQRTVVGVYSTRPSYLGNGVKWGQDGYAPLAIAGVVRVKVSAENGPILPGDLLVASATPGHAMRAGDAPPVGTVIGKALGALAQGTGVIQVLAMLQ
jgi:hypothetical protein